MKTVTFTEFRKHASGILSEVEKGEKIVITRHGRPIAEITPHAHEATKTPAWKMPGLKLAMKGSSLSKAILEEREA